MKRALRRRHAPRREGVRTSGSTYRWLERPGSGVPRTGRRLIAAVAIGVSVGFLLLAVWTALDKGRVTTDSATVSASRPSSIGAAAPLAARVPTAGSAAAAGGQASDARIGPGGAPAAPTTGEAESPDPSQAPVFTGGRDGAESPGESPSANLLGAESPGGESPGADQLGAGSRGEKSPGADQLGPESPGGADPRAGSLGGATPGDQTIDLGQPCGQRVAGAVAAADAEAELGRFAAVEFRVARTYDSGRVTFLNSHDPYAGFFYVAVFPDEYEAFPSPPARYFDGRCVLVQGRVERYEGTPQIVLRTADDIRVVGP